MSASILVRQYESGSVPVLEARAWRENLLAQLRAGTRVVTLYGRRQGDDVLVTAVLQALDRTVLVSRTTMAAQAGYHELTSEFPALHCFERELHEHTGLRVAGHPWLKPIRYEGQEQSAMKSHDYYRIEGKEVHEVAVGPIHAGVIEPGSFRFMCHGEQVYHLEIQLGYQHRGVEKRLLEGDPCRLAPLVETIAGDTSVAHAWAYCAAIESLAGIGIGIETEAARAVVLELERVAMHLASLAGLAADVGHLQGATTYGRLRTTAINTTMRLCGSRFGRGALRPGGIGMKLGPELLKLVRANIELLRRDLAIMNGSFLSSWTVRQRLKSIGVLATQQATDLGIVGLAARASGVPLDARQQPESGAYKEVPVSPCLFKDGDCFARARLRISEMDASLAWLTSILDRFPEWKEARKPVGPLKPHSLVFALAEGWRGEVIHCIETGDGGRLVDYRVQDPSLRNWMGLAIAMRRNEISDFPICNKSFDLSYCGNDL